MPATVSLCHLFEPCFSSLGFVSHSLHECGDAVPSYEPLSHQLTFSAISKLEKVGNIPFEDELMPPHSIKSRDIATQTLLPSLEKCHGPCASHPIETLRETKGLDEPCLGFLERLQLMLSGPWQGPLSPRQLTP